MENLYRSFFARAGRGAGEVRSFSIEAADPSQTLGPFGLIFGKKNDKRLL
jgi:hypothetical protein